MKFLIVLALSLSMGACVLDASPEFDESSDVDSSEQDIIGGYTVWRPWQVRIATTDAGIPRPDVYCGGSLIAESWVLTAGHCVVTPGTANVRPVGDFTVHLGDYDLSWYEGTEQQRTVQSIILGNGYVPGPEGVPHNDIALIKLATPAVITNSVRPIYLARHAGDWVTNWGAVAGWGQTSTTPGSVSNVLREADLWLQTPQTCSSLNVRALDGNELCAGSQNGAKTVCFRDSGGPLVGFNMNGQWTQFGIVSWGSPQCNSYGVFAGVYGHINWIVQHVGAANLWPAHG